MWSVYHTALKLNILFYSAKYKIKIHNSEHILCEWVKATTTVAKYKYYFSAYVLVLKFKLTWSLNYFFNLQSILTMSTSISTSCSVNELLQKSFSLKSFEEKNIIIKNSKPCPPLSGLLSSYKHRKQEKEYTRHFSERQYSSISWLTGCNIRNKLFCWPCILFSKKKIRME